MEEKVAAGFRAEFGREPTMGVRAPGRVNLIGEHIDYSGYSVLPMALKSSLHAAFAPRQDARLDLRNLDPLYPAFQLPDLAELSVDANKPEWHKYFLCGVKGAQEALRKAGKELVGMDVLVWGEVAPSAGLSSSSALVVAAVLGSLEMGGGGSELSRREVAEVAASCERYIGTEGGGMDQAICLLAQASHAMHIQFQPLRATPVRIPDGASFVVAHSGLSANKAAASHYNERVVECRLAAALLAKRAGLSERPRTLGALQTALGLSVSECAALAERELKEGKYGREEVCAALGVEDAVLASESLSANTQEMQEFSLRSRALHVWGEAGRVASFAAECGDGGSATRLGQLMDESQRSCADLYECSCPELDALVSASRRAGALGSRLTGAGWGGCTVSLLPTDGLPEFMDKLKDFYQDIGKPELFQKFVFVSEPAQGAQIFH